MAAPSKMLSVSLSGLRREKAQGPDIGDDFRKRFKASSTAWIGTVRNALQRFRAPRAADAVPSQNKTPHTCNGAGSNHRMACHLSYASMIKTIRKVSGS